MGKRERRQKYCLGKKEKLQRAAVKNKNMERKINTSIPRATELSK
jgi:hypothetical protein